MSIRSATDRAGTHDSCLGSRISAVGAEKLKKLPISTQIGKRPELAIHDLTEANSAARRSMPSDVEIRGE